MLLMVSLNERLPASAYYISSSCVYWAILTKIMYMGPMLFLTWATPPPTTRKHLAVSGTLFCLSLSRLCLNRMPALTHSVVAMMVTMLTSLCVTTEMITSAVTPQLRMEQMKMMARRMVSDGVCCEWLTPNSDCDCDARKV